MQSLRSRFVNLMVRKSHLFRGKLKKEIYDDNTSIQGFRDSCEKGAARYAKVAPGVQITKSIIVGINSEIYNPEGAAQDKIIMYVHGGGYVAGSCDDHRGFVTKFAKFTGVKTLIYEYGLAPENPYPAALDDSLKIYSYLLSSGYKPDNIIIAGESAGGGLCLAILLALKETNIALPKAAVAISPWTDLTCSSDSYKTKNKLSPAPLNSWFVFSKHYVANNRADLPYISPLFGDLQGLPPILICSGVNDELYDDGEKFYLKAKQAGVDAKFIKGEGQMHCYPLLAPMFPEATVAMNEIVEFIRGRLNIQ